MGLAHGMWVHGGGPHGVAQCCWWPKGPQTLISKKSQVLVGCVRKQLINVLRVVEIGQIGQPARGIIGYNVLSNKTYEQKDPTSAEAISQSRQKKIYYRLTKGCMVSHLSFLEKKKQEFSFCMS